MRDGRPFMEAGSRRGWEEICHDENSFVSLHVNGTKDKRQERY